KPLVATLFNYRAFTALDVDRTAAALMNYGVGLLGIVSIKVLAPGFYARQDTATPMRIAAGVLVLVQVLNYFLVPPLQHAALTLSISIGAAVNALLLLAVLVRRGSYRPSPGWGRYLLQVIVASALLAVFLMWGANAFEWTGVNVEKVKRVWTLILLLLSSGAIYFAALRLTGLRVRTLLRH
ncbi:MAG: lipid II flippase MurJ, partial [Rhodoferax sp.]